MLRYTFLTIKRQKLKMPQITQLLFIFFPYSIMEGNTFDMTASTEAQLRSLYHSNFCA